MQTQQRTRTGLGRGIERRFPKPQPSERLPRPRSSAGQSDVFLKRRPQVRDLPRALLAALRRFLAFIGWGPAEERTAAVYVLAVHVPTRGVWVAQWWVLGSDGQRMTGQKLGASRPAAILLAESAAEITAERLGYTLPAGTLYRAPASERLGEVRHG